MIPVLVGLLAQATKMLLNSRQRSDSHPSRYLPRYGGMPSAHTAFAFSLATVVAVLDGFYSASFAIVASLVIFVLDDALRMRIFLGRHGHALHQLVQRLPESERKAYPGLETHLGHRPLEVFAGGILGLGLTLILLYFL